MSLDDAPRAMAAITLSQFDEEWSRTPTRNKLSASTEDAYSDVPDGVYDAVIEEMRLTETVTTRRPILIWTLRIVGPQAANRVVRRNRVIMDSTLVYLKEDLEKCGLSVSRLSELAKRLDEMTGRQVAIEKRTKGEKANFFFRWKVNRVAAEIAPEDDIPF